MDDASVKLVAEFITKLVAEGEDVLKTTGSGSWRPGQPMYVQIQPYAQWTAKCRQLAEMLGDAAAPWRAILTANVVGTGQTTHQILGTLKAIAELLQEGLLVRIESLVRATAFGELLDQAEYLSGQGYKLAAGTLGRAVLEEHLRKWCTQAGCLPTRPRPTLNDLNQSLYNNNQIDVTTMKQVDAMTAVGNDAAHNKPTFGPENVEPFLRDIRAFLARHPTR